MWAAVAVAVAAAVALTPGPAPRVLAEKCLDCSLALWQSLSVPAQVRDQPVRAQVISQGERKFAPEFARDDATGRAVRLSNLRGQVVLLNFWATWCGGCQVEIPWFVEFENKYREQGLAAVGVAMDDDGWKSVQPYMRAKGVNYAIVIGDDKLAGLYGVVGMPVTVLIDREGRIAASHAGAMSKDTYQKEIEALIQEK